MGLDDLAFGTKAVGLSKLMLGWSTVIIIYLIVIVYMEMYGIKNIPQTLKHLAIVGVLIVLAVLHARWSYGSFLRLWSTTYTKDNIGAQVNETTGDAQHYINQLGDAQRMANQHHQRTRQRYRLVRK